MNAEILIKLEIDSLEERLNTTPCKKCLELLEQLNSLKAKLAAMREEK